MTVIDRAPARRRPAAAARVQATNRLRMAVRMLVAAVVAVVVAALGSVTSPAATLALGVAAILWLMLSFEADTPAGR